MKKLIFKLLFSVFSLLALNLFGQNVVTDTNNIKKPKSGGLYYQKKDKTLYLFREKFEVVNKPQISVISENPIIIDEFFEREIGTWNNVPNSVLVVKNIDSKLWLFQTDKNRTFYVFRGKNFLSDKNVKLIETIDLSKLSSEVTGLGGLMPAISGTIPSGFNLTKWQNSGFKLNSKGEWILNSVIDAGGNDNKVNYRIKEINYLSPGINDTNWEQFKDISIPKGYFNTFGQGSPLFNNEPLAADGSLLLLKKGITNIGNLNTLPKSKWDASNSYFMKMFNSCIFDGAKTIVSDLAENDKVIVNEIIKTKYINYSNISIDAAIELGRGCYNNIGWMNSADNPFNWNIQNTGVLMLDEEPADNPPIPQLNWSGGGYREFLGYVSQGITKQAPKGFRVDSYGPVMSWYGMSSALKGRTYSLNEVKNEINNGYFFYDGESWKNTKVYGDISFLGYLKVPYIDNRYEIYEKNNDGSFKILNGQRVYRNSDFEIENFGEKSIILKDMAIQRRIEYPTWEVESKYFVQNVYSKADAIMFGLLKFTKSEFGNYDISKFYNEANKLPYIQSSLKTEPWTPYGNDIKQREIGIEGIKFETIFPILSGIRSISTWGDGGPYFTQLPNKGNPLWNKSDNYSRHMFRSATFISLMEELQGLDPANFKFIHFYYPFLGQENKQIISSGIYVNNKLIIYFVNPSCGKDEFTDFNIKIENSNFDLKVGRDGKLIVFENVNITDTKNCKLSYKNIYGKQIEVNGVVNNIPEEHYIKGLENL